MVKKISWVFKFKIIYCSKRHLATSFPWPFSPTSDTGIPLFLLPEAAPMGWGARMLCVTSSVVRLFLPQHSKSLQNVYLPWSARLWEEQGVAQWQIRWAEWMKALGNCCYPFIRQYMFGVEDVCLRLGSGHRWWPCSGSFTPFPSCLPSALSLSFPCLHHHHHYL